MRGSIIKRPGKGKRNGKPGSSARYQWGDDATDNAPYRPHAFSSAFSSFFTSHPAPLLGELETAEGLQSSCALLCLWILKGHLGDVLITGLCLGRESPDTRLDSVTLFVGHILLALMF